MTDLFDAIDRTLGKPADPADPWPPAETQRLLERLCEAYIGAGADADGRAASGRSSPRGRGAPTPG